MGTIMDQLYDIAILLTELEAEAEFFTDALVFRQARSRVVGMMAELEGVT